LQLQSGDIDEYLMSGARFAQGKGPVLRLAQHCRLGVSTESYAKHDDQHGSEENPLHCLPIAIPGSRSFPLPLAWLMSGG
jgi:hypothetical protein